jgi:hypothetical protein
MNAHQFYNLLEGRVKLGRISKKRETWQDELPVDYIERFNASVDLLEKLAEAVTSELRKMTDLEQERFQYYAWNKKSKPKTQPN